MRYAYVRQIQYCHGKNSIQQEEGSFYKQIGFQFKEETSKVILWSTAFYGAETWALQKLDQKNLESFEMWYWRRMGKISWAPCQK
jgi:hypothetical protein